MRTRLRLFLEWGITFEEEYRVEEQVARKVYYADQNALTRAIVRNTFHSLCHHVLTLFNPFCQTTHKVRHPAFIICQWSFIRNREM